MKMRLTKMKLLREKRFCNRPRVVHGGDEIVIAINVCEICRRLVVFIGIFCK